MREVACRACGGTNLREVLSLGRTPLANSLLSADELEIAQATYPLELVVCSDCTLSQITETMPPEELFSEYLYFSSFSDTMLRSVKDLSERMVQDRKLSQESLVVEIASNDGYLLQNYVRTGVPVLGIEPAQNIARVAVEQRGVRTICKFFGAELARELADEGFKADVIHANNVLAHVPDLNGFVKGIRILLGDDGVAVIEVPYAIDMIDGVEFDTIYHEHLCYFTLTALASIFERHGLVIRDVERLPIHGGSLRLFAGPAGPLPSGASVQKLLEEEANWGIRGTERYRRFARQVEYVRLTLNDVLHGLKSSAKRIVAYGASAKGSTLLNYLGLGQEVFDFVVDRSTVKQGKYTPRTRLPIYEPAKLLDAMPDYVLLLTWNFAEEIISQQSEYVRRGGVFLKPLPTPQYLTAAGWSDATALMRRLAG